VSLVDKLLVAIKICRHKKKHAKSAKLWTDILSCEAFTTCIGEYDISGISFIKMKVAI